MASSEFGMSASHPAGKDDGGEPNKALWAPPEGTAQPPSEENNPLQKLLMDLMLKGQNIIRAETKMQIIRPNPGLEDPGTCEDFQYDDGGQDHNWSEVSLEYPENMGKGWLDKLNENYHTPDDVLQIPEVDLTNMNQDQLMAFNITMKTLNSFIDEDKDFKPLRMIVSGTVGSGKSFLIKCLVKAIRMLFNNNKSVQVLCPTGNSANLISGVTLHSFLKIPTRQRGKETKQPEGTTGEILQNNCRRVHVLLIDERSLIGANTLGWMEFMCKCGMYAGSKFDQSWDGLPVDIFFGDDVQLPPVLDAPVYHCKSPISASMHGVLVWNEFDTAVHLQNIVRQGREEEEFRDILLALRQHNVSSTQAKWLQQFQWNNLKAAYGEELLYSMSDEGLFVFPTHAEEWQHNKSKLLEANRNFPIAKCIAVSTGPHSKGGESCKAGGLLDTPYLCRNATVMLSVNLCVPYGLFNGAMGRVTDIIYLENKRYPQSLPDVVMVEFPNYTGP
ncbi:ATP-dependent DNA helicase PIF1-like [Mizuhopecten yessoensis]|uniref:ATP-dependent DNA helicase PIF1-like n=1 Tax=Mizuhopecten yessoensis TaxID=6573 RepID=UPI000B45F8E1|nr:ATP-dependent DNA helicase PIF1-like [Mizuhopecten yessoensis]